MASLSDVRSRTRCPHRVDTWWQTLIRQTRPDPQVVAAGKRRLVGLPCASRDRRNHPADVLRLVAADTHVTVTAHGRPVAELRPVRATRKLFLSKTDLIEIMTRWQAAVGCARTSRRSPERPRTNSNRYDLATRAARHECVDGSGKRTETGHRVRTAADRGECGYSSRIAPRCAARHRRLPGRVGCGPWLRSRSSTRCQLPLKRTGPGRAYECDRPHTDAQPR